MNEKSKSWPFPDRPGVPSNPEKNGLHYISDGVALWYSKKNKWVLLGRTKEEKPEWLAEQSWAKYHGPCPCPGEALITEGNLIQDNKEQPAKKITLGDANKIRIFIRDLEDIDCLRNEIPGYFLVDQDEKVRESSWKSALDMSESMIKAELRKLGVDV